MRRKLINKKAVNYGGAIILTVLLITSVFAIGMPSSMAGGERPPKLIWGIVTYCNGGAASGASVVVTNLDQSFPDETDTTDGAGYYQVDIGPDTGDEWLDGDDFSVTVTIGSWSGTNTGTVSGSSTQCDVVLDPPVLIASADATPTTILVGESVSFDGEATGGATPYSWSWDFDGDGTSNQEDPTHTFNTEGTYNCELTVTDDCGNTDTDSVTITVNPALSCDAGGPYSGTICSPVTFSGSASGGIPPYSYSWDFGDGGTGTGQNPSYQYTADGTYTATLTVTDTQGSDTDTATVTITTAAVSANAGGPYSGTICSPVSFSGSATGGCSPYSYSWDFGDGGTGTGQNPSHQYTADGTYTATLTVTDDNGQTDTDTATVTILTSPLIAQADGPYTGTMCNPVSFFGSASGGCSPYSYSWDFGDGFTGDGPSPTHQYAADGTYTATLTVTDDAGQTDTDTATVTITTSPLNADAGGPYEGNEEDPIEFSGSASGGCFPYTYSWDFGDGGSGSGQNPIHIYQNAGTYTVTLTVTDDVGQTDSDTATCTVLEAVVNADAGGPYTGETGEPVQFSGSASEGVPPYTYFWQFGDGISGSGKNPTHTYQFPGTYDVYLTVTDSQGNSDMDITTASITGEPPEDPIADANGPYSGKVNSPVQFTGSAAAGTPPYSYEWDFGDGGTSTDKNPSHTYTSTGTFDVSLTVTDDKGKKDTDTTTATISQGSADLLCGGTLSWSSVESGAEVSSSFTVRNIGDSGTSLNWEITSFPEWGTWTFTPDSGVGLKPTDGFVTVDVSVVAPTVKSRLFGVLAEETYEGEVIVENSNNANDKCSIPVSMVVPRVRFDHPMIMFLSWLMEKFPFLQEFII